VKITIITVVYNNVNTLEQTILSVLRQTYKNIEYIIIDGGSNDGTVSIIKKYETGISYWISEKDDGIYNAMNKGIGAATGEYIQFLGADDFFVNENVIERVVKTLEILKRPDILSAAVWIVDEKYKIQRNLHPRVGLTEIITGHMLPHQGIFMRAQILKNYRFNEIYRIGSDFELLLKCILHGKNINYMEDTVVFFCNTGVSSYNEGQTIEEYYQILRENLEDKSVAEKFIKRKNKQLLKQKTRKLLDFINCLGLIRRIQGWQKHHCTNEFCRWCKSGEKMHQ